MIPAGTEKKALYVNACRKFARVSLPTPFNERKITQARRANGRISVPAVVHFSSIFLTRHSDALPSAVDNDITTCERCLRDPTQIRRR